MNPIASAVLRQSSAHRKAFRSEHPLPNFHVIPGFLEDALIDPIVRACQRGKFRTYCGYAPASQNGTRSEYCEPNERDTYVTIHERPVRAIRPLIQLYGMLQEPGTLLAISKISGLELHSVGPPVLTAWQPGSFLEPHTDYLAGGEAKLILSISFTRRWREEYGGTTVYAWKDFVRGVRVQPRCNTSVLFVPHAGSTHWVEQISPAAPARRRFTWTVFFA